MMSKTAIYWAAGLGVVAVAAVTPAILKFYDIGWPGAAAPPPALSQKAAEGGDGGAAAPAAPSKASAAAATETPAKPAAPAASATAPVAASPAAPPKAPAAASAEAPQPKAAAPAAKAAGSPPAPAAAAAPAAPASPQTSQAPAAQAEAPAKADAQRPAFDVVRVEPSGDAVIAGRASPRAAVQLRSDGRVIAQVDADADSQFAILPPPFPAGDHRLQLAARSAGAPEVLSDAIGIEVPAAAAPAHHGAPIAAAAKPAATPPKPAEPSAAAPPRPAEAAKAPQPEAPKVAALSAASSSRAAGAPLVSILSVEANGEGRFEARGAAEPNALVRLYLNNAFVAEATAGADGRWSLTVERGMTPGPYAIRADEIDRGNGAVSARAEVPFDYPARPTGEIAAAAPQAAEKPADQAPSAPAASPAPRPGAAAAPAPPKATEAAGPAASANPRQHQNPASSPPAGNPAPSEAPAPPPVAASEPAKPGDGANPVVPEIRTTKVVRGDNLWNLSKRFYGYGPQYTVLYEANASQIRDPNLIYPDQIFVVPSKPKE